VAGTELGEDGAGTQKVSREKTETRFWLNSEKKKGKKRNICRGVSAAWRGAAAIKRGWLIPGILPKEIFRGAKKD